MLLTRNQLDTVLIQWCKLFNVSYTNMHDEAFCVRHINREWLYLWYNDDENLASEFIKQLENLLNLNVLEIIKG
ncbi:hypothetical protein CPT_Melin_049 [Acinetobacter phage Melin]|nr:hypothetical protein CPT_Melin_049 [Acinetobacter phage Melin]